MVALADYLLAGRNNRSEASFPYYEIVTDRRCMSAYRIPLALPLGSTACIGSLLATPQLAACAESSVDHQNSTAEANTEVRKPPPFIEVKSGPVLVPVPEADTQASLLKSPPAGARPGLPKALVPAIIVNVAPNAPILNPSEQPASVP
jgi:hypothetical protein